MRGHCGRLPQPALLDHREAERRLARLAARRRKLEDLDGRDAAWWRPQHHVSQVEVEAQLAHAPLDEGDRARETPAARDRSCDLGRQQAGQTGELDPIGLELEAPGEPLLLGKRTIEFGRESEPGAHRLRQARGAPDDDPVAVATQHQVKLLQRPGRDSALQVAQVHRGIVDLHASGRQAVEIERRLVRGALTQAEQAEASVRKPQHRHGRPGKAHTAGDQLPRAQHVPQVERDAALAHRAQGLAIVTVQDAQVVEHQLGAEPAQARVQARELQAQLRLALHPRLHAVGPVWHSGEHDSQQ